jgi:hypothetical protein
MVDVTTIAAVAIRDFAVALMRTACDEEHYGDLDCHDIVAVAKQFGVEVGVPQQQTER